MSRKDLKAVAGQLAVIPHEEERVLLATGRYLGEGFDDARLDTLFLTMPVSWQGTIAQYVGRLHRLFDGKSEVRVYDYADLNVPVLARMFDRRCRGYEAVGYKILLPASAVPGWPPDVPLPVDPWGRMEVDLLCQIARLAIELDGSTILETSRPAGAIVEKTSYSKRMAISFCASLQRTWVRSSIWSWMQSREL
jgi:hypothetical protein